MDREEPDCDMNGTGWNSTGTCDRAALGRLLGVHFVCYMLSAVKFEMVTCHGCSAD